MQTLHTPLHRPAGEDVTKIVTMTLEEDIGSGDITASLIPAGRAATAKSLGAKQAFFVERPLQTKFLRKSL